MTRQNRKKMISYERGPSISENVVCLCRGDYDEHLLVFFTTENGLRCEAETLGSSNMRPQSNIPGFNHFNNTSRKKTKLFLGGEQYSLTEVMRRQAVITNFLSTLSYKELHSLIMCRTLMHSEFPLVL